MSSCARASEACALQLPRRETDFSPRVNGSFPGPALRSGAAGSSPRPADRPPPLAGAENFPMLHGWEKNPKISPHVTIIWNSDASTCQSSVPEAPAQPLRLPEPPPRPRQRRAAVPRTVRPQAHSSDATWPLPGRSGRYRPKRQSPAPAPQSLRVAWGRRTWLRGRRHLSRQQRQPEQHRNTQLDRALRCWGGGGAKGTPSGTGRGGGRAAGSATPLVPPGDGAAGGPRCSRAHAPGETRLCARAYGRCITSAHPSSSLPASPVATAVGLCCRPQRKRNPKGSGMGWLLRIYY